MSGLHEAFDEIVARDRGELAGHAGAGRRGGTRGDRCRGDQQRAP